MSTNAMIWIKPRNQKSYKGVYIHWDGYVNNGVGEYLIKDWNDGNPKEKRKEVFNLLKKCKYGISSFGSSINDCNIYHEGNGIRFAKDLFEVHNHGEEYNYLLNEKGIWMVEWNGEWIYLNDKLKELKYKDWQKQYGWMIEPPKFKYKYDI